MNPNTDLLSIGVLLPHAKLYGGVKRFLELGNQFVELGHSVTIYTPTGEKPTWFSFKGDFSPISELNTKPLDALFFTEISFLLNVVNSTASRKIYYIVNPSVNLKKMKQHREIELFANSTNLLLRAKKKFGIEAFPALGGVNLKNFSVKTMFTTLFCTNPYLPANKQKIRGLIYIYKTLLIPISRPL